MIQKPTSHFLGYTLGDKVLLDLFTELSSYIRLHNISDQVQLQNHNTIHITLYYLPLIIEKHDLNTLSIYLNDTNTRSMSFKVATVSYFMKDSHKKILYLSIQEKLELLKQNNFLREHFPNNIFENTLSFVPHITILRILDPLIFELHQSCILKIINKYMFQMTKINGYLDLYAVDSTLKPELQEVIQI